MSFDKNIAALMRPDARTVQVIFVTPETKEETDLKVNKTTGRLSMPSRIFTYITDRTDLQQDDMVVVVANGRFRVATVVRADEDVTIEPGDEILYLWVIDKVDFSAYNENMAKNKAIEDQFAAAKKRSLKRSFTREIIDSMEDGPEKDTLLGLIGAGPARLAPASPVIRDDPLHVPEYKSA